MLTRLLASMVNFLASGAGAVLRTVQEKLRDHLTVQDFGAKGDGVTDDTAAFVAALATGRTVHVPKGTYYLTAGLQIPDTGSLVGAGWKTSVLKFKTSAFTGNCISMGGYTNLRKLCIQGDGTRAATAVKVWDSANQYNFTGYVTIKDISISGLATGLFVNNVFMLLVRNALIEQTNTGIQISPAYNGPGGDNGYCTTITFDKVDCIGNVQNLKIDPTLLSKNIVLRDCGIEGATGTGPQASIANCQPLTIVDSYIEGAPTVPGLSLVNCVTNAEQLYLNGTGGIDLGAGSNTLRGTGIMGTSATDVLIANGTSLQNLDLNGCEFPGAGTLNASFMRLFNCKVGGVVYANRALNARLNITDNLGSNASELSNIVLYKKTVSATVGANSVARLIYDQYLPSVFAGDSVVAVATLKGIDAPALTLSVGPATTGSSDYLNVIATNSTASDVVLTDVVLCVLVVKGTAVAL